MPSDRSSLIALRELIADTDLTLETIPDLVAAAGVGPRAQVALALCELAEAGSGKGYRTGDASRDEDREDG